MQREKATAPFCCAGWVALEPPQAAASRTRPVAAMIAALWFIMPSSRWVVVVAKPVG
jgi:hypothetical protein